MRLFFLLCAALAPSLALAQSPVDLNTEFFRPATGNGFFGIQGARSLDQRLGR